MLFEYLLLVFKFILIIVTVLIGVAYYTLCDRKIMAAMQRRSGPNVVGLWGLLQPLADGLKLFLKEFIIPNQSNKILFFLAPCISFMLSLLNWIVIPSNFETVLVDLNLSVLFIFAISSIGVYGIILSGWSSNSKFAFLGSLRSVSQLISYEISLSLLALPVLYVSSSLNLSDIVLFQEQNGWNFIPMLPIFLMFIISGLAETNRVPFDLPEAEAELVAGYNIEYSGMGFALFFLAEYSNMLLMSSLIIIFFLGGWSGYFFVSYIWYGIKMGLLVFLFVWVRGTLPRYRYDQLMKLGWKVFLPLSLGFLIFYVHYYFLSKIFIFLLKDHFNKHIFDAINTNN
jgi:NADH-quinone oxidoreductase subunit H